MTVPEKSILLCNIWLGLLLWLSGKESTCNAEDLSSIPGLGRSPGEGIGYPFQCSWVSLVAQTVNNLPAMRDTWVQSLGWEDPLQESMAPTPVLLPGESPRIEEPGRSWDLKESDVTELLSTEQQSGSKSGKEFIKAVYCHPAYLTYIQSTSWEMLHWMKHKLESRLPGEISITPDDTTFMEKVKNN